MQAILVRRDAGERPRPRVRAIGAQHDTGDEGMSRSVLLEADGHPLRIRRDVDQRRRTVDGTSLVPGATQHRFLKPGVKAALLNLSARRMLGHPHWLEGYGVDIGQPD